MSFIQLNADTQRYHVAIPPTKRMPPNPHIGDGPAALDRALAPASDTADTNSELTPESRDDKDLRYRLLAIDQRSFFTGSAAADLQAAHVINAVRRNRVRKQRVEAYLTQQKLHHPAIHSFVLDSAPNAILLEASLHVQWDLYGTFCIVPTEEDASAMLRELRRSNELWQRNQLILAHSNQCAARPLDISNPPFAMPHWEIIVLHPRAILPDGQPLAITQNRSLYRKGQTQLPTTSTWSFWVASGDHLSSLQDPEEHLDPFVATNLRDEFQQPLCSLAMIVNAHCKLEQFLQNYGLSASDRVKKFGLLMSELATEIFFVPQDGYVSAALTPPQLETVPAATIAGTGLSQSALLPANPYITFTIPGYSHDTPSGTTMADSMVGNGFRVFRDEVEAPEIPDADGLTNSEFQLVSSKAEDPNLNAKERADAAIMMLFGTHRYANPYNHASQSAQS